MTDKPDLQAIFGTRSVEAIDHQIDLIVEDDACSDWMRTALTSARKRDPVDALNDAEKLTEILDARFQAVLARKGGFDPGL